MFQKIDSEDSEEVTLSAEVLYLKHFKPSNIFIIHHK